MYLLLRFVFILPKSANEKMVFHCRLWLPGFIWMNASVTGGTAQAQAISTRVRRNDASTKNKCPDPKKIQKIYSLKAGFVHSALIQMGILKSIQTSPLSDAELLALYRQNLQQELLAQLFLRYNDLVYGTCVKYLGDQDAAKDAVMNIYSELVEKVKQHMIDNFKGWLYAVTKNHCLMQLRRNKKLLTTPFDGQVVQSEDFSHLDSVFEKERQLDKLSGCMQQLNDEQRQTVRLFYLENKCYNEITELTGFDWNKVRSLVQNGRRNLKICMENNA